jgi:hypothetical protein
MNKLLLLFQGLFARLPILKYAFCALLVFLGFYLAKPGINDIAEYYKPDSQFKQSYGTIVQHSTKVAKSPLYFTKYDYSLSNMETNTIGFYEMIRVIKYEEGMQIPIKISIKNERESIPDFGNIGFVFASIYRALVGFLCIILFSIIGINIFYNDHYKRPKKRK